MLAILARSGQYLPVCLTFGPTNGPEDFAFATDRVFAPGRGRKMRFCTNWQIYADDITIRSGRWLDGVYYTDSEHAERLREAQRREASSKPMLDEAFKALGFNPEPLGAEKDGKAVKPKRRSRTPGERAQDGLGPQAAGDPSPRAHVRLAAVRAVPCAGRWRGLLCFVVLFLFSCVGSCDRLRECGGEKKNLQRNEKWTQGYADDCTPYRWWDFKSVGFSSGYYRTSAHLQAKLPVCHQSFRASTHDPREEASAMPAPQGQEVNS